MSEFRDPQYGPPPGYGPPAYGPPQGYGQPTGYGAPHYGPPRPGMATAAAVLGFVTAGLTIPVTLVFLVALLTGNGDPTMGALVLGLPARSRWSSAACG